MKTIEFDKDEVEIIEFALLLSKNSLRKQISLPRTERNILIDDLDSILEVIKDWKDENNRT